MDLINGDCLEKLWKVLPMEIVNNILMYAPIQPLHFLAYKTGIRIITSCELNSNLSSGEIKLIDERDENDLDEEWFMYLLSQQYNI